MSDLSKLKRPSGGFAMLAIDQREALREMMSKSSKGRTISDEEVIDFKLNAGRKLTPYAACALIASGDLFIPAHDELVGEVEIDPDITPEQAKALGAVAQKLLVIWRADQPAEGRIDLVRRFVEGCHQANIVAIIEPVCKKPVDPAVEWDPDEAIVLAAEELGALGADLYKGQVPTGGKGSDERMRELYARMNAAIDSEWVILSSGVAEADFPRAIELAVAEGASGFLAGRAVWASCLDADDVNVCLETAAAARLQAMGAIVDKAMEERSK